MLALIQWDHVKKKAYLSKNPRKSAKAAIGRGGNEPEKAEGGYGIFSLNS